MSHIQPPPGSSFRSVNGALGLEQLLGRRTDIEPYILSTSGSLNASDPTAEVEVDLHVPGDLDVTVLAASMGIVDSGTPAVEGFTGQPNNTPSYWWAHAEITQDHGGRKLSNIPVSVGSIFGRGDRPFIFPAPWELKAGTKLEIEIYSQSTIGGNPTDFYIALHGIRRPAGSPPLPMPMLLEPRLLGLLKDYMRGGRLGQIDPYFYSLMTGHDQNNRQVGHAPMASESPTFTVSGHDFALCYLMGEFYEETGAAFLQDAALGLPDLTVQFVLDEGAIQLSNRPLHINTIVGHGTRWMKLPVPLLIENGHSLTAIVTPLKQTGSTNQHWLGHLTFAGARLYGRSV